MARLPLIYLTPGKPPASIDAELRMREGRLNSCAGKEFLLLPVSDPLEAALWILASFRSPLAVVPFSAQLPAPAITRLESQLPAGKTIFLKDLPASGQPSGKEKDLAQPWAVVFSSGSTGDPKGVILCGSALRASALAHAEHSGINNGAWLLNLPLFHMGGIIILIRAYFLRTELALASLKFSVEETLAWIKQGRVAGVSLVPTTLGRLLALGNFSAPGSLKMILVGAAPLPPYLQDAVTHACLPIFLTYGMTEHSSQIATEKTPGAGMSALPGVEIKIDSGGEILVRSSCLASGVFHNGEKQALPLRDGFLATGDLGAIIDGKLIVNGRKSDLILSGGINVFPAEIERELSGYPGLADFGVVGVFDPEWGEAVSLAYVPENNEFDTEKLLVFLRSRLDHRKVPKHLVELTNVPRSALGKILRPALRETLQKKILADS